MTQSGIVINRFFASINFTGERIRRLLKVHLSCKFLLAACSNSGLLGRKIRLFERGLDQASCIFTIVDHFGKG